MFQMTPLQRGSNVNARLQSRAEPCFEIKPDGEAERE